MRSVIASLAIAIMPLNIFAASFPLPDSTWVDQTYGDYNNGWYHDGIDFPLKEVDSVYSPVSGTIVRISQSNLDPNNSYVAIQSSAPYYWFVGHIIPNMDLHVGDSVVAGVTDIGTVAPSGYRHLHIGRSYSSLAYYKGEVEDPLTYFTATQSLALSAADIMVIRDQTPVADRQSRADLDAKYSLSPTGEKVVYHDVDVIVFGRNNVNGRSRSGVYRLDYSIEDSAGTNVVSARTPFIMQGLMNREAGTVPFTYLAPPSQDSDGIHDWDNYYNITNSGNATAPETLDANIQENSWRTYVGNYKDGRYKVKVKTYTYPPTSATAEAERFVVVDNLRPYLERVEIKKSGVEMKYLDVWSYDGSNLSKTGPTPNDALGDGDYTVYFRFSEPVVNPTLSIDTLGGREMHSDDPAGNQKNFSANFSVGNNSPIADGLRTMTVQATDLAGTSLRALTPAENYINNSEFTRNNFSGFFPENAGEVSVDFTVDRTAPFIYLPGNEDGINGVQSHAITISKGSVSIYVNDDPESLCDDAVGVCKAVSGISRVMLLNDSGSIIYNDGPFLQPETNVAEYNFNIADGSYTLDVFDAAGNETRIPITVSGFSLEVSTAESHVEISPRAGTFTGTIHVRASSSSGLVAFGLVDSKLTSKYLQTASGTGPLEADLVFGGNINDYFYKSNMFGAGFSDMAGRIIWQPISLSFVRQAGYGNGFGTGTTSDAVTDVLDLVGGKYPMLPGAIMSLYSPTPEERQSAPEWWWGSNIGGYSVVTYPDPYCGPIYLGPDDDYECTHNCEVPANLPINKFGRQNIGTVQVAVKTWDATNEYGSSAPIPLADREVFHADKSFYECGDAFDNSPCFIEKEETDRTIQLKRYVETSVSITKVAPTEVIFCGERLPPDATTCPYIQDYSPIVLSAGPVIYGLGVKMGTIQESMGAMVPSGHNIVTQVPDGILIEFGADTVFTPGILRYSYSSVDNYPGFNNLSGNLAFRLKTEATFDHAKLTIPYNAEGLTSAQENGIKIYKITDAGEYIALGTTVDAINKKVQSSDMDAFGRFFVAAPRYVSPQTVSGSVYAGDKPELEFTAEGIAAEQNIVDVGTPEGLLLTQAAAEKGFRIGNIYRLGPTDLMLGTPGTLKMHFDPAVVSDNGITSLSIYRADVDGTGLVKLSGAISDPVNHEIAVDVWQPAGLYVLIGEIPSEISDVTPPQVTASYSGPQYSADGKLYVSTLTTVSISGNDSGTSGGPVSGMGSLYYSIDASPVLENPMQYSGPFNLNEGVRALYYSGSDMAGNMSATSSGTVYVDGTSPNVSVLAGDIHVADADVVSIPAGSLIVVSAVDQASGGVSSGNRDVFVLIDTPPASCNEEPAFVGPVGTCNNPRYSGAFALGVGTHTVYYTAFDNVGNQAPVKSVSVTVIGVVNGAIDVNGAPEVVFNSQVGNITVELRDPSDIPAELAEAASRQLQRVSGVYELGPDGFYPMGTSVTFSYSPTALPAGISESEIAVYEHFASGEWKKLSWQTVDTVTHKITAPVTQIASLFAIFGADVTEVLPTNSSTEISVGFTPNYAGVLPPVSAAELAINFTPDYTGVLPPASAAELTVEFTPQGYPQTYVSKDPDGVLTVVYQEATNGGVPAEVTVAKVTEPDTRAVLALAAASGAELSIIGNLYDVGPDGTIFTPEAEVFYKYDETLLGGIDENLLDVYRYDDASGGWQKMDVAERNTADNWISFKTDHLCLFGIFQSTATAPAAFLSIGGGILASGASAYITVSDAITLTGNALAAGLAYTIDAEFSASNATTYAAPFLLDIGEHTVYYTAFDASGAQGGIKYAVLAASAAQAGGEAQIAPSSGPIGIPFTVTGDGFGTYTANYTQVLIGGATAPLTLWTDTQIKGTVPGTLAAGEHAVAVMRGTSTITNAAPFAVLMPAAADITPSSGAIGVPFTINGANFGNYVANYTRVLIGGATAPLTLWADSKITGTIPGGLAAGAHDVVVERALNGGSVQSQALQFTLIAPEVAEVMPSSGAIGVPFTINGANFGNYVANYTRVLIGGATAPLTLWSDTQIKGTVPGSLAAGDYELVVERELNGGVIATQPVQFKVLTPTLTAIVPSSGSIGVSFTLTGADFGNYVANYTRVLIGGATAPLTLWTDTQIKGTVPGALVSGTYEVAVERELNGGIVRSSTVPFTLVAPSVASITPSSGAIGVPFTINGTSFGNYVANYTKVLIGGTTAPLTLWSDTQIKGTVPGALSPGDYELIVTRELNGGVITTQPAAFKVLTPEPVSVTPSSGAIGVPFTILGADFGNYVANYTKVLIGGTAAPLTLWSDTKIQGTVPGGLDAGGYELVVERALNGGVVRTSTWTFTVIAPEMSSLTPSSGPIGVPFTIMGANFGNYVANYTKVLIGGATAPLTLWSDTKIQGTVPGALMPGDYELYVERAVNGGLARSATAQFTVGAPFVASVSPSTAAVIAPFTITGYNFGNYVANYTKVLIGGTTAPLTLWTESKIQGKLPFLTAGEYPVLVQRYLNGGLAESATAYIAVIDPVISSMTPTSGAAGTVFNLYGAGFGPYDAAIAKVFLGGAACALSLWTDTNIRGTVPASLSFGTYTVVAMRGQALSNGVDYVIPNFTPSMFRIGTINAEFKLGEVYVYPNPAKGGKVPVFHVEVGVADTVKIRVFTVAGQLAHETTLGGMPQAIGSTYAYEYAWEGRIASGVYYYTMEAEKGGKKIKSKGKFAVVR